tara:strand:- start:415 stop:762 length:348 start_codon:yes stop_codon:yes gene_type:complete
MGIRSEVALAIKNETYVSLTDKSKETIRDWLGEYQDRDEEGLLFVESSIKWYYEMNSELVALYQDLNKQNDEGYLLIVATPEYVEDTSGDRGLWTENPWYVEKQVSVEVYWEGKY